jgi:hypothetical protein
MERGRMNKEDGIVSPLYIGESHQGRQRIVIYHLVSSCSRLPWCGLLILKKTPSLPFKQNRNYRAGRGRFSIDDRPYLGDLSSDSPAL